MVSSEVYYCCPLIVIARQGDNDESNDNESGDTMQRQWLFGFVIGLVISAAGFSALAAFKPEATNKLPDKLDLRAPENSDVFRYEGVEGSQGAVPSVFVVDRQTGMVKVCKMAFPRATNNWTMDCAWDYEFEDASAKKK